MRRSSRALLPLFLALTACQSTSPASGPADPPVQAAPNKPAEAPALVGSLRPGEPETPLPIEADDIVVGASGPQTTVVVFLDLGCPFCKEAFALVEHLRGQASMKDVRFVIKHLPLDIHPQALPAALAAQTVRLASDDETAFRFMSQSFQSGELDYMALAKRAEQLQVDLNLYRENLTSEETIQRVAGDARLGARLGVSGTPAFFVNGHILPGAQTEANLLDVIAAERGNLAQLAQGQGQAAAYAQLVRKNINSSIAMAILDHDPRNYRVPVGNSPVFGPEDAKATLVVFSDYQCPYCKKADATLAELRRRYPRDLRVVFKHFPLEFHERARDAANTALAICDKFGSEICEKASEQLFAASPSLSSAELLQIGKSAGLEEKQLRGLLEAPSSNMKKRLSEDQELAEDLEVQGTPTVFLNGRKLPGALPLERFVTVIDEALRRAQVQAQSLPAGVSLYDTLQQNAVTPSAPELAPLALSAQGHPQRGGEKAKVDIHVFSDFQCPYCRTAENTLEELDKQYPGQLRFVWHDLPLSFHEHARTAALAAREARRQKGDRGFWAFHDALFNRGGAAARLGEAEYTKLFTELKLDPKGLKEALEKNDGSSLDEDEGLAEKLGIRGTPGFVVGGYLLKGARPSSAFARLIELRLRELAH